MRQIDIETTDHGTFEFAMELETGRPEKSTTTRDKAFHRAAHRHGRNDESLFIAECFGKA